MPIFDDVVPADHLWPITARKPLVRAEALLNRFRREFPSIHYDLFWETRLMNAQAFLKLEGRCVRLYGGLARHRRVRIEGLAFALAHETGHHLGGYPFHPFYSSISSEQRADEWALQIGLIRIFGPMSGHRYGVRGFAQLDALRREYSLASVIW